MERNESCRQVRKWKWCNNNNHVKLTTHILLPALPPLLSWSFFWRISLLCLVRSKSFCVKGSMIRCLPRTNRLWVNNYQDMSFESPLSRKSSTFQGTHFSEFWARESVSSGFDWLFVSCKMYIVHQRLTRTLIKTIDKGSGNVSFMYKYGIWRNKIDKIKKKMFWGLPWGVTSVKQTRRFPLTQRRFQK